MKTDWTAKLTTQELVELRATIDTVRTHINRIAEHIQSQEVELLSKKGAEHSTCLRNIEDAKAGLSILQQALAELSSVQTREQVLVVYDGAVKGIIKEDSWRVSVSVDLRNAMDKLVRPWHFGLWKNPHLYDPVVATAPQRSRS
jgi:hypothetical protein